MKGHTHLIHETNALAIHKRGTGDSACDTSYIDNHYQGEAGNDKVSELAEAVSSPLPFLLLAPT